MGPKRTKEEREGEGGERDQVPTQLGSKKSRYPEVPPRFLMEAAFLRIPLPSTLIHLVI